jgi:mRNA interferase RelE/StbE
VATVNITDEALKELSDVPRPIQKRIYDIVARLEKWPAVSGAKPLRGDLQGSFRIRTGDYRVVFNVSVDGQTVKVWKIGYRGSVYE